MSATQSGLSWLYDTPTEIDLDRNISRKKKIEQILKAYQPKKQQFLASE